MEPLTIEHLIDPQTVWQTEFCAVCNKPLPDPRVDVNEELIIHVDRTVEPMVLIGFHRDCWFNDQKTQHNV